MRNNWKKRRFSRGLFLLSILLIGILTNVWSSAPIKAQKKSGTPFAIEETSYETWTATDLPTAQQETKDFLEVQKVTGATAERPYKGNTTWTEGSLMAVDKAYQSSLTVEKGVSTDLARMLLIETVKKLEKRTTFAESDPSILSVNNYPNENGEYDLEYNMPAVPKDERSLTYRISFVLDWSGSMDDKIGLGAGAEMARLKAKLAVESLAEYVIDNYAGSKVQLLGYNSTSSNANTFNRQVDTGFIGEDDNYQRIIDMAYSTAPKYREDDVPAFNSDAASLMKYEIQTNSPDSIPVIVTLSDFQLTRDRDSTARYSSGLTQYWTTFSQTPAAIADPQKRPIYLAVRYDHAGNAGWNNSVANGWQSAAIWGRDRWQYLVINNSNAANSGQLIQTMLTDVLPNRPSTEYNMKGTGTDFDYSLNSVVSTSGFTKITQPSAGSINFNNKENDTGSLKVNYRDSAVLNKKMGDLLPSYTESNLTFVNSEYEDSNKVVKGLPNLFSPVSEAAVEVYHYKGAGDKEDASNYERKQTIVGNTFNNYGGTETYPLINTKLSSIEYGTTLSKANVLGVVEATLGQDEYKKWDFSSNLTAASQKITFDAAKNVYKVYAESNIGQVFVEYLNELGETLQPKKPLKDIVGETYIVDPVNEPVAGYEYLRSEGAPLTGTYGKDPQTVKLIYRVEGELVLVSAPPVLNFRTHAYKAKTIRVDDPDYEVDLVVQDSRPVKTEWTLNAKLTEEMANTAEPSVILKDAIRYVYLGKELTLTKNAQPIMVHSSANDQPVNISKTWKKTKDGDGFKLELEAGDIKKLGNYQAEILWELSAIPVP